MSPSTKLTVRDAEFEALVHSHRPLVMAALAAFLAFDVAMLFVL